YVGRTFIQPTQAGRDAKVKVKYNPVREVLEGKSVVMVDDSIVRGTTTRGLVAMVRAAGAKEVHLRVSSPPVTGPCYYGIDTPSREELIAAKMTEAEIAVHLGVDSLGYLSLDGMLNAVPNGPHGFCHACFSGDYPTPPPTDPDKLRFGCGSAEGTKDMRDVLGGKGANLAEMTNLGVPVPPGFTIACPVCVQYLADGTVTDTLRSEVAAALRGLESITSKRFGDPKTPL